MKYLFIIPAVIIVSCTSKEPSETLEGQIKKVESSLVSPVYFEGDSTWTIEERMKHYHVPGVTLAVILDNKIAWVKSYGVMDTATQQPVTGKTLFQAGSISKPVAAYGALKIVEEGKINLDHDVNTYLSSWKLPENEFTKQNKVALKHLLSHTGGLTVHGFWGYSPDLPVPTLIQVLDGVPPANSPPIRVDKVPEESFRYSGGGYCIMQQMLIDVEGKPFPQILKEKVLQPLEMTNSTYDQPLQGEQLALAATGYLPDGSMTKGKRHTYPEMAAAGLWTTAEDLAKFAIDVQKTVKGDGSKVLSKSMAEKMLTPFVTDYEGLGMFIQNKSGDIYFGHGGWDEGFSSEMTAHKDKGYGVVVLTNSNHPEFISELLRAVALAYNWSNYLPRHKKLAMDTAQFKSLTGRYRNSTDGLIIVSAEGNRLFRRTLRGKPMEMLKVTDSTYASRENDQLAQFKINPADGKLNVLLTGGGDRPEFVHPKLADNEIVPYEFLLAGDFDRALKGYQALMASNPKDESVNENNLNEQGYNKLREGNVKQAKEIFKVNMILYPKSWNVYDSYAEACMKDGDRDEAIANFKKSLALNAKNENAAKKLEELKKDRRRN